MTQPRSALPGVLLALLAAIAPAAAGAATLDVSPSGSGTACTPGSPCALSTANANAQPGDVIRLAPGTYSGSIDPARNGTAAARITYVGNLANPASTVVGSTWLEMRYITIKGVRFNSNLNLDRSSASQYAQFDSIAYCQVANTMSIDQAKDCVVYRVDVTGGTGGFSMKVPSTPVASFTIPERNVVRRCTMHLGRNMTTGTHVVFLRGAQNCVVDSNRIFITLASNISDETDPLIAFYCKWNHFRDNYWRVHSEHNANHLFRWRDSTMYNRTYRDSFVFSGYNVRFAPSSAGSYAGTTDQNYFEGIYVKNTCRNHDVALWYQNGSRRDTIRNAVVIDSAGTPFQCLSMEKGATLIDHCTFVGGSQYGVVQFPMGVGSFGDAWPSTGRLVFTNNLMYSLDTGGSDAGIGWQFSSSSNDLTSNNNLYYVPGSSSSSAIRYAINNGAVSTSAPGTGQPFYNAWGEDGQSIWGNPQFVSLSWPTMNLRLQPGSPGIGAGTGGSDIGAYGVAAPDVTPPATVGDLALTQVLDRSAVLAWTAPGDDGMSGTVAEYDLRLSTSPITAGNFSSAPVVSPPPAPGVAGGGPQTFVLLNLTPGTAYWAAIRARDAAGNWSAVSNIATATTSSQDLTPPATIQDLSTSGP
jgi:hypothetical protein